MKRLLPALLASTALALVPGAARAQTVTKTGATSIGLGTVNGVAGQPIFLRGSTVLPLLTSVPAGMLKGVNGIPTVAVAGTDYLSPSGGSIAGNLVFPNPATPSAIVNLYSPAPPSNYTGISGSGAVFSYTPYIGGPGTDISRAQNYMRMLSTAGLEYGENNLNLDAYLNSGYAPPWAAGQTVAAGAETIANGNLYKATSGGQTASGGTGPSGTGTRIQDNSVVWSYVAPASIDPGKVNLSMGTAVGPQAGPSWGAAFNYILLPGWAASFGASVELDFGNLSGRDCYPGGPCNAFSVFNGGNTAFPITSVYFISAGSGVEPIVDNPTAWTSGQTVATGAVEQNGGHAYKATTGGTTASSGSGPTGTTTSQTDGSVTWAYYSEVYLGRAGGAAHAAITFSGPNTIANQAIGFGDNAQIDLYGASGTSHSIAFLQDQSNSASSLDLGGVDSNAAINEHSGTKASPTPFGMKQSGVYSGAAYNYQDILIGQWGGGSAYSALSFNDTFSQSFMNGFFGKNGDANLYGNTQGSYIFRVNNALALGVNSAGVSVVGTSTLGSASVTGAVASLTNSAATCAHTPTTSQETVACSSDARLKRNIVEARSALAWLDSFDIREFDTRKDGSHHTGVIAQEVRRDHPELVHDMGDGLLGVEQPDVWKLLEVEQQLYRLIKLLIIWAVVLSGAMLIIGHRLGHTHWVAKNPRG